LTIIGVRNCANSNADMRAIKSPWLYRAIENPQLYWAEPLTVLTIVAIFTALFFLRHIPHEFYYPPVPAAADGVDRLSCSDGMTSWCGEQSIEGLADRFGAAPTPEAAAWAVANEASDLRDGLWWNVAYQGCLRGLRSPQ
jgi:hypothetical protein